MPPAVGFEDVSKTYPTGLLGRRPLAAVRRVSFGVEPGEVVGLLGPNRAGKSTLLKMLLTLCHPDSGRVTRLGRPSSDRSTLAKVGYVPERPAFPRHLSAAEALSYYGALSRVPAAALRHRVPALLERVALADRAREPIGGFSKGMIQRLALAQALVNDPDLLVLDEPGEGLDLDGRRLLATTIRDHRDSGRAVLLVSHNLAAIEGLCDRAAVIVEGRLAYWGPAAGLVADVGADASRSLEQALLDLYAKGDS